MKRALTWILILIAAGAALAGLYAIGKRNRVAAPTQDPAEAELFSSAPAGAGALLSLNTATVQPMRSVRFLVAQEGGGILAQALTQTGDQMIGRFQDGRSMGSLRLPLPDGMPAAFFRFAKLADAADLKDGSLLLLFVDGTGGSAAPWLVDADAATGEIRWTLKAAGSQLAMEPGGASCLVWSTSSLGRASWNAEPAFKPLPMPDGVTVLDAVQAMPGGSLLAASPGGLARFTNGGWTTTPLPDPGDLAFPGMPGALASLGKSSYWQPRPGQLARLGPDGAVTPVDLTKLAMPAGREKDAALLRLAGADAGGHLWFALATPDLTVAPHSAAQPSAALQAMAAMSSSATPAPASKPALDPASWMDYLKNGLDRVYVWDPDGSAPRLLDWKARWTGLGAPSDFPLPLMRDLHPEDGTLLMNLDTRAWWVPMSRLPG
ncbi:MAG TPA: hypothetical protein VL181_00220 [Holophagaceae bacterium]|nr:hypothetical protein [Holophagaceae bacterium]